LNKEDFILFSGGAAGAEEAFGAAAERAGIEEVNFSFDGHITNRTRGLRVLNHEELQNGDFSLTYVSKLMKRRFPHTQMFRRILQSIWYQVNSGQEIYVVGVIQSDDTVQGGTGWGAEFTKLCNKPLFVFDQEKGRWFMWKKNHWEGCSAAPVISHVHFSGTGTRHLNENGLKAINDLFDRSFSKDV